jgi:hypothetical protein
MRFILLVAAAFVAIPASAFDLTGTWEGGFSCSEFFDGAKSKSSNKDEILEITQVGSILNVMWVGEGPLAGFALADAKKPDQKGAAALVDCATTTDLTTGFAELANLQVTVNRAKGKGSLKGTSVYTGLDGSNYVGQCKWSFKLVNLANPGATGCP